MVATARKGNKTHEAENDVEEAVHDEVLNAAPEEHGALPTAADLARLRKLGPMTGEVDRSRFAMAETLIDAETLRALETYAAVFAGMSIDVAPAIAAVPEVLELEAMERRFAEGLALVHRHLAMRVAPIAAVGSDVHRVVAASPEGSAIRGAFSKMETRWQRLYGNGGRTAGKAAAGEPKTPTK